MFLPQEAKNDEAKIDFQKTVMGKEDDEQGENLGTLQKDIEDAAGKVAHSTKKRKRNFVKRTPENVRIRAEAAARCTKVIKRRALKKQARKARAETLGEMLLDTKK